MKSLIAALVVFALTAIVTDNAQAGFGRSNVTVRANGGHGNNGNTQVSVQNRGGFLGLGGRRNDVQVLVANGNNNHAHGFNNNANINVAVAGRNNGFLGFGGRRNNDVNILVDNNGHHRNNNNAANFRVNGFNIHANNNVHHHHGNNANFNSLLFNAVPYSTRVAINSAAPSYARTNVYGTQTVTDNAGNIYEIDSFGNTAYRGNAFTRGFSGNSFAVQAYADPGYSYAANYNAPAYNYGYSSGYSQPAYYGGYGGYSNNYSRSYANSCGRGY